MRTKKGNATVIVILILILAAVGYFGVWPWLKNRGNWQAVFLTNNQVYFGHLSFVSGRYVKLSDVHYLRVAQSLQPPQSEGPQQPNIQLVQLGGELHGPEREMYINRENILFWEHLRNDSRVVAAIKQLKEQRPNQ